MEKTDRLKKVNIVIKKHLHERGENFCLYIFLMVFLETPPRTWRKRSPGTCFFFARRNTSTNVEKTYSVLALFVLFKKHLHERGENSLSSIRIKVPVETPPRTWRKLDTGALRNSWSRNTSTNVEKTDGQYICFLSSQKHLHERGENPNI